MNKGFAQIVRTLTRIGLRIELITNGTLLDDDTIAALADADVRLLVISFDGARRETYEHIRRRASYDHTLERVRLLKRRMAPATLCAANCTVSGMNHWACRAPDPARATAAYCSKSAKRKAPLDGKCR